MVRYLPFYTQLSSLCVILRKRFGGAGWWTKYLAKSGPPSPSARVTGPSSHFSKSRTIAIPADLVADQLDLFVHSVSVSIPNRLSDEHLVSVQAQKALLKEEWGHCHQQWFGGGIGGWLQASRYTIHEESFILHSPIGEFWRGKQKKTTQIS